jgi:protein gp37
VPGYSFNPWWGCVKVSPGCEHCYAETFSKRTGHSIWGPAATTQRRTFGDRHWQEPLKWNADAVKAGERRRVFCASMADVFEDHPQLDAERARLWELVDKTPALDWLLLTKRPENVIDFVPGQWFTAHRWPSNVWIGTSVENQAMADKRIPHLINIPAPVRFLSCEPLLGPVNLEPWLGGEYATGVEYGGYREMAQEPSEIQWVIVGGESGPKARPMDAEWVRSLRDQCNGAGVAFHFKQWGGVRKHETGRVLDDRTWDEYPEEA